MHNLKQLISNRNNELHNRKHTRMENNHLLKRVYINFWNPNRIRTNHHKHIRHLHTHNDHYYRPNTYNHVWEYSSWIS